jgi:hypothetical protein
MAAIAYLDIDQGSDFTTTIELENDDGTAMNLSGVVVYSQFRKSYGSTVGYQFTTAVPDSQHGKISLSLSGTYSSTIKPGRYLYDVELYYPITGAKTRVVEGIVTINAEITKIP